MKTHSGRLNWGICAVLVLVTGVVAWAGSISKSDSVGEVNATATLTWSGSDPLSPRVGDTVTASVTVTNTNKTDSKTVIVDVVVKFNRLTVYDPPATSILVGPGATQTYTPASSLVVPAPGTYTGTAVITVGTESKTIIVTVKAKA